MSKRSIILFVAVVLMVAFSVSVVNAAAGVGPKGAGRPGMGDNGITLPRFAKVLNLSAEQTGQVKTILTRLKADLKALWQSGKTKEEKQAEVKKLREQAKADINAVLNADQKAIADKRHLVDRLLAPGGGKKLMRCLATLGLSEQQKTDIKGILKNAGDAAKAVRQDKSLTIPQKKAKIAEIHKAAHQKVMDVLTADQKTQLEKCLKSGRPGRGAGGAAAGAKV